MFHTSLIGMVLCNVYINDVKDDGIKAQPLWFTEEVPSYER